MGLQELVLLLLFSLPLCSAQNTYYVLPTPNTPCPVPGPGSCCVLSECVEQSDRYFTSNTMLVFLPGNHILDGLVHVEGVNNLTLTGESPTDTSRISCSNAAARFVFYETLGLTISALAFESCGSNGLPGVSLLSVSDSRITKCAFQKFMFGNCSSVDTTGIGSALLVRFGGGNIVISDCSFENNTAVIGGGAFIRDNNNSVNFIRNRFVNNTASFGGGLALLSSIVTMMNNSFVGNTASQCLATVIYSSSSIRDGTVFMDNTAGRGGGLFVQNSDVVFSGDTNFEMNLAQRLGGAMLISNSTLIITGGIRYESNSANYGAAVAVIQSNLIAEGTTHFQNNHAIYGAGIYSREANLTFNRDITLYDNRASFGGAIYASSSTLNFEGYSNFIQNSAANGGGLLLTDGSTIQLFPSTEMHFMDNNADTGGAIEVKDNTPLSYCSDASLTTVVASDCFFQLQNQTFSSPSDVSAVITFINNTAALGGSDLYGGTIDSCRLQNTGLADMTSGEVFDRVTGSELQPLSISSEPLRVCLCRNNSPICGDSDILVGSYDNAVYPGQSLQISVATFGQRNGRTAGIIRAQAFNNLIQFQDCEIIQRTSTSCTTLNYTLLTDSLGAEEKITLFADGPCQGEEGFLETRVSIYPCPPGFQLSGKICVCHERLNDFTDITCNISNKTILRPRGAEFWVGYNKYNDNHPTGLIISPQCPFDYCRSDQSFIQAQVYYGGISGISEDAQCNDNRVGTLCGRCYGSLVLGSSRCDSTQCSDRRYNALIVAFAVAGIALVFFLFILKLTVANGTINGLIFYANLVQVNSSIFYPPGMANVLTVFIAWINLDLGIETCFYTSMIAYEKAWLQFAFPIYVWALVGVIILISHYSQKVTNLLGSNPIAVLATLFLLSYAKVLRTIITALSFTSLRYPGNVNVAVWPIDGRIEYLTGKHIPLFLTALLALLILFLPYTLFLFLAQWMQILQGKLKWRRIFSWLSKPSARALLDTYHAPHVNKHRYWTGLLLLIRCVLFLIFATAGDSNVNLLAIASVTTVLISFVLLTGGIYKSWYLGALETSLLLNLVILTAATYHVKVSGGNQAAVVNFFLSIVFITFAGIITFHIFLQIKTLWKKTNPGDIENTPVTSSNSTVTSSKPTVTVTSINLRELLLDEP